jgi:four helix bundle protein
MATALEDVQVLRMAEAIADEIWSKVVVWDQFAREVVGQQLARAADSIGANIAEAFGRYHYGEKIQFLYYSRGSLFETKYWLNRAHSRGLMPSSEVQNYALRLTELARRLNVFVGSIKRQRNESQTPSRKLHEAGVDYTVEPSADVPDALFDPEDLEWLQTLPAQLDLANL